MSLVDTFAGRQNHRSFWLQQPGPAAERDHTPINKAANFRFSFHLSYEAFSLLS